MAFVVQLDDPHGSRKSQSLNNLHQIGIALHNYVDVYGTFPPASIDDASGRPMVSWRALLLPFVEQRPLYETYRFDRRWDDAANDAARRNILSIYGSPLRRRTSTNYTDYVAVTSRSRTDPNEQTAFPGLRAVGFRDITDGTSNTIVAVEVRNSNIEWSEPRDIDIDSLTCDPEAPNSIDLENGALVVFADASAQRLPSDLTLDEFKALLTISEGESTPEDIKPTRRRGD